MGDSLPGTPASNGLRMPGEFEPLGTASQSGKVARFDSMHTLLASTVRHSRNWAGTTPMFAGSEWAILGSNQ